MLGEAGPLKGALSMLRGGLHVWSPRTQHPREMGVAWMQGPLGGFDMVTGHLSMEPSHKDRHEADTAAWPSLDAPCLHALTFCRHRGPSPAGPQHRPPEVLAAPVPGRQRLAPALLAGARLGGRPGPCTRWLSRASYSETCPLGELGVLGLVWELSGFNPGSCVNSVYALLS